MPRDPIPLSEPFSSRRAVIVAAALILVAGVLAYANSLRGPFVFDDPSSITTNPTIRRLWPFSAPLTPPNAAVTVQGRPLLNFSLALNYAIAGEAVPGYHALNLAIHLGAALTLFGLVRRTLLLPATSPRCRPHALGLALTIALLWVAHPLQTQAVTYVIQRAESLMGLFYLLTLYGFIRGATAARPARWLGASVCAAYLGMATKEVMVTAPVVVLFYDRAFVAGSFRAAWRARRTYYVGLASAWVLLGWLVAGTGGNRGGAAGFDVGVGWWDYALTQFVAIAHYLRLALWPQPLVFEYGTFWVEHAVNALPAVGLVSALAVAALIATWRKPALGFAGLFFFAVLSVTSIVPGTTQMIVEHRMYLPLAAVLAILVLGLHAVWPGRRRWAIAPAVVAFILTTQARNDDYRSELRLWRDTVTKRPANALAREMHAQALERAGDTAAAITEREVALHIFPGFAVAHCNLGDTLSRLGRINEAIPHYEAALRDKPNYADAHNGLGSALAQAGRLPEAVDHFTRAVALFPDFAEARHNLSALHNNLGNAFAQLGRLPAAERAFTEARRLMPENATYAFNFGNLLLRLSRLAEARAQFAFAVAGQPTFVEARGNLGAVLLELREPAAARVEFDALIALAPQLPSAHLGLGEALYQLGERSAARSAYERALALDPNLAAARTALQRLDARPSP